MKDLENKAININGELYVDVKDTFIYIDDLYFRGEDAIGRNIKNIRKFKPTKKLIEMLEHAYNSINFSTEYLKQFLNGEDKEQNIEVEKLLYKVNRLRKELNKILVEKKIMLNR